MITKFMKTMGNDCGEFEIISAVAADGTDDTYLSGTWNEDCASRHAALSQKNVRFTMSHPPLERCAAYQTRH